MRVEREREGNEEMVGELGFETEMLACGPRRRQRAANSEILWAVCGTWPCAGSDPLFRVRIA